MYMAPVLNINTIDGYMIPLLSGEEMESHNFILVSYTVTKDHITVHKMLTINCLLVS